MLCFTSNRASVAADAVAIVNYESKIQVIFLMRVYKLFLSNENNKKI
jgi:hypothetical protein